MESTASPLKAAPAKLRITLFTFSLLATSSSRIGEPKDFSWYRAEEQDHQPPGGAGQGLRRAALDGMAGLGEAPANHAARSPRHAESRITQGAPAPASISASSFWIRRSSSARPMTILKYRHRPPCDARFASRWNLPLPGSSRRRRRKKCRKACPLSPPKWPKLARPRHLPAFTPRQCLRAPGTSSV
jgi:hypothetical protein